ESDCFCRGGIEDREHARLAVGVDDRCLLKSGVARELRHHFGAGGIVAILGGDRRQRDPILQSLHRFVVTLGDFGADIVAISGEQIRGNEEEESDGGCNRLLHGGDVTSTSKSALLRSSPATPSVPAHIRPSSS